MKLSEFVEETLSEIEAGIKNARKESNSPWIALGSIGVEPVWKQQTVDFEIAVTTSKEGGGGLKVFSAGELRAGASKEEINRISFSVPVFFNSISLEDA
ncbi:MULTISPECIES: trypco2 family protein [Sulfitobacter]|uniref:Trypco2 family protein n=1 Tax=Sulfitobacter profundi TaxID=2679961 RepID=A0ABW1Z3G7_9RHOB|nr:MULTISPECIES: trypco2 family protein [Sulfitobacter]UWR39286.1 hypothetical protein K3762_18010 [Sulfitobacter sp. W074]